MAQCHHIMRPSASSYATLTEPFELLNRTLVYQLLLLRGMLTEILLFYAFLLSSYKPIQDRRTDGRDGRTGKIRIAAYYDSSTGTCQSINQSINQSICLEQH